MLSPLPHPAEIQIDFLYLETGVSSHSPGGGSGTLYIASQTGLELMEIHLPLPLEYWD